MLKIVFDKPTNGYRVEKCGDENNPPQSTKPFASHAAAMAYLRACESAEAQFSIDAGAPEGQILVPQTAPVMRSSAGLRAALFDELDAIRNGTSDIPRANAVSKLVGTLIDSVRMEIEVDKHARKTKGKKPSLDSIDNAPDVPLD